MLDGDHNYHTVYKEMQLIEEVIMKPTSIVVIDDFLGKWATKDMWYSEKSEYADIDKATPKPEESPEREGVQNAVLDFINHAKLPYNILIPDPRQEPAILYRADIMTLDWNSKPRGWAQCDLLVKEPQS